MRATSTLALLAGLASIPASIKADTYAYDARGRLIGACQFIAGNGRRVEYHLDAADNRSEYSTNSTTIIIPTNSSIYSPDGRFQLTMQGDGNLVLYGPSGPLWGSNTVGSGSQNLAAMQGDGNFVSYTKSGTSVWSSNTYGGFCGKLSLQSDGNLVIYDLTGKPLWSTNTGGH